MSQTYVFCMSDVVFLEPCTKEHYVECDKKTARNSTKKRHFHKKTTALNLSCFGPLMHIGVYKSDSIYIQRPYIRALYIEAYIDIYSSLFKKRRRQRSKAYKHRTSRTSHFQGSCSLICRPCQCRKHMFFVCRMLFF